MVVFFCRFVIYYFLLQTAMIIIVIYYTGSLLLYYCCSRFHSQVVNYVLLFIDYSPSFSEKECSLFRCYLIKFIPFADLFAHENHLTLLPLAILVDLGPGLEENLNIHSPLHDARHRLRSRPPWISRIALVESTCLFFVHPAASQITPCLGVPGRP